MTLLMREMEIRDEALGKGRSEGVISTIDTALKYGASLDSAYNDASERMNMPLNEVIFIYENRNANY